MVKKIDIILPVYKEQDNIIKVLEGIKGSVKTPHTINLIYFSKNDPTIPVVKKVKKNYKNLHTSTNSYEKGLVGQYKTGFKNTNSEVIVIMMSDLSDNPKDIDKMVEKINRGYDFVCGSRYIPKGKRKGGSMLKGFISYLGCLTLSILTGIKTKDATNAYKCFKREILKKIKIESKVGYEFPLELIVKSNIQGYKITEIPTIWVEREKGYSKFKLLRYIPNYMRWYFFALKNKYL